VLNEGVSEIWLTSEDTGAYGRDIVTSIATLLTADVAALPEDGVMLRLGMTNPPFILEHLDAVSWALNHPKVFSFLHIPVQAGSNRVLNAMNREYSREDFETVADHLLKTVPNVTIATDIICGFPGETEEDFDETMSLMEKYKLAIVNISQFYPRPGTPAAKMKRIDTKTVKNRSRRLSAEFNSWHPYTKYSNTRERVWFCTEIEGNDNSQSVGHTKAFVKVVVPYDADLPGTSHEVDIHSVNRFHVEGVIVDGTRRGRGLKKRLAEAEANALTIDCVDGSCGSSSQSIHKRRGVKATSWVDWAMKSLTELHFLKLHTLLHLSQKF
jgi:threonylcarbamoyladenosine tRNA methylthiotransferase CDKAL1